MQAYIYICLLDSSKHNMHSPVTNVACSCKLTPCLTTTSSEMIDIHAFLFIFIYYNSQRFPITVNVHVKGAIKCD